MQERQHIISVKKPFKKISSILILFTTFHWNKQYRTENRTPLLEVIYSDQDVHFERNNLTKHLMQIFSSWKFKMLQTDR